MKRLISVIVPLLVGLVSFCMPNAVMADGDEADIRQIVDAYVAAFNEADAEKLASFWAEDAVYVAPSGEKYEGSSAILEGFNGFFKEQSEAKLTVSVESIDINGDTAIERGTSRVTAGDKILNESQYAARYIKRDGKWTLIAVREADKANSNYEHLKGLEWMIGQWIDEDETGAVRTTCRWTKNKNFISRSFSVSSGDLIGLEGTQVIGWDADKQTIRSWLFDSDGGFGVGIWSQDGDRWIVKALRVLSDGQKGSATNVLTKIDDDSFTWESTGRAIAGEILPNIGPVTVVRQVSSN